MISKQTQLLLIIFITTLTACNGEKNRDENSNYITGRVITDNPAQAKVCIDMNKNMQCDKNEAQTQTDANGYYKLDTTPMGIVPEEYSLVAQLVLESQQGMIVANTLNGVSGCNIISPLTTMVNNLMQGGETKSDAMNSVKEIIVTDLDVCIDYLAIKDDASKNINQKNEATYLYQLSSVFHGLMHENEDVLVNNVEEEPTEMMHQYVVHNQMLSIGDIITNINEINALQLLMPQETTEQVSSTSGTPISFYRQWLGHLCTSRRTVLNPVERDMKEEMRILSLMNRARVGEAVYQYTGVDRSREEYGFYSYFDNSHSGRAQLSFLEEKTFTKDPDVINGWLREFDYTSPGFGFFESNPYRDLLIIPRDEYQGGEIRIADIFFRGAVRVPRTDVGWTTNFREARLRYPNLISTNYLRIFQRFEADEQLPLIRDPQHAFPETLNTSGLDFLYFMRQYDLSGRKISSLLNLQPHLKLWSQSVDSSEVFEPGATGFKLSITAQNNAFTFFRDEKPIRLMKPVRVFSLRYGGDYGGSCGSKIIGAFAECLTLEILRNDDFDLKPYGSDNVALETISETSRNGSTFAPVMPIIYEGNGRTVFAWLKLDGTVRFYEVGANPFHGYTAGGDTLLARSIEEYIQAVGSWKMEGNVISITIPSHIKRIANIPSDEITYFEYNGNIIRGNAINSRDVLSGRSYNGETGPATFGRSSFSVNGVAHNNILNALDRNRVINVLP